MTKKQHHPKTELKSALPQPSASFDEQWHPYLETIAERFDREYQQEAFDLPPEVEAMPVFQEWNAGRLQAKIASAFWELHQPKKNQHWLDIGCGLSFLVYPWRDWDAYFYGQELSSVAQAAVNQRGPQLNSKLFRGIEQGPAHHLRYGNQQFDGVVATGFSCYFSLDYGRAVLAEIKRVLKPEGILLFDLLDPETELAENWAILETYLGTDVFLEPLQAWQSLIAAAGGKIVKTKTGELFQLLKIKF